MLLSVAPLFVIVVSVAGLLFDRAEARAALARTLHGIVSDDAVSVVTHALEAMQHHDTRVATLIATLMLLWAASGLFVEMQTGLNMIWGVTPSASTFREHVRYFALKRSTSLAMVIGCGALLLASLVLHTVLTALGGLALKLVAGSALPPAIMLAQEDTLSLALLTVLFAMIFRVLPDAHVSFRDVGIGALLTAVLTLAGTRLLGYYFTNVAPLRLNSAVGSLSAFMLWTYYLARVIFFGAAFTRVWAVRGGRSVVPNKHAQLVT